MFNSGTSGSGDKIPGEKTLKITKNESSWQEFKN